MPRSEARLQFDIWEGLDALPPDAKLLYCVLLTDRSVNHAGQGFTRIDRWEKKTGLTDGRVEKAMLDLEECDLDPHVAFDRTTGEFLIRTMIRNDSYEDQPYLLKGALAVAKNVESTYLRRILAKELRKLPAKKPDGVSKSGKPVVYPDPHACADAIDPGEPDPQDPRGTHPSEGVETLFDGSRQAVETHLSVAPEPARQTPSRKGLDTHSGGGSGGGSGSCPVSGEVEIKASAREREAKPERLDVHAARLIGTSLPRGIGRGCRGELQAAVARRLQDEVPDQVIVAALDRWVKEDAGARAIEFMLDDAVKKAHGAVNRRRGAKASTTEIVAAGRDLTAHYEALEAAESTGMAPVHQLHRGAS